MTKSIAFAVLLGAAVAACAQAPAEPPPAVVAFTPATFVPYCGQLWKVAAQGYVDIPCPHGINYDGAR